MANPKLVTSVTTRKIIKKQQPVSVSNKTKEILKQGLVDAKIILDYYKINRTMTQIIASNELNINTKRYAIAIMYLKIIGAFSISKKSITRIPVSYQRKLDLAYLAAIDNLQELSKYLPNSAKPILNL